jgi:hypothetical protein
MEYNYNQMISDQLLDNIHAMNQHLDQPTMFGGRYEDNKMYGGKRYRKFVLPGSDNTDFPGSLSVGHLGNEKTPSTLGKSFWKDFGETEFINDQMEVQGGSKVGKFVGQLAKQAVSEGAKELGKQGVRTALEMAIPLIGLGKSKRGKKAKSDDSESESDDGRDELKEYVEHLQQQVGGQKKGAKMRAMFGAYQDGNYPNFDAKKIGNPSKDVKARFLEAKKIPKRLDTPANRAKDKLKDYLKMDKNTKLSPWVKSYLTKTQETFADNVTVMNLIKRVEKRFKLPSKREKLTTADYRAIDNASYMGDEAVHNAREKKAVDILSGLKAGALLRPAVQPMDGGKLVKYSNASSVLPPGLQSDTGGKDAYGRGKPMKKPSARGAIVKEVMQKMKMSLPEASKYVKEHGLY